MLLFTCVIPGPPQPKQRARVTARGTFTPKATKRYERAVRQTATMAVYLWSMDHGVWPLEGEYELACRFFMAEGQSCDVDNMLKSVADGLEKAAYKNDRMVAQSSGLRVYGDPNPRTEIVVRWLGPKVDRAKSSRGKRGVM